MHINQIEIEHIERLNDVQLTKLLHSLLQIELKKNGIDGSAFVPFNITTGDGGDDGRIQWTNGKDNTKWLKSRFCLFQNKATKLDPSECYEEILLPKKDSEDRKLKPMVQELVESDGCYVLFINKNLNTKLKVDRITEFRRAIKDAGFSNHDTLNIEVFDTNSIKDWVNKNIGSVTLVQKFNNISRPGFRLWEEWEQTLEGSDTAYQTNNIIKQHIQNIYESLAKRKPIRIIGHSGLGKTRLVLEAFREKEDNPDIIALKKQLVYFEIGVNGYLKDLSNYIISHTNQEGIIVVDNCDEESHRALSGLVNSMGKFHLITIDIASTTNEETSFKLERDDQRDIVKGIINEKLGSSHSQSDRDYLNSICEGYPWMAVKFCNNIQKNGIADFSNNLPKEFIKRLLFSRNDKEKVEYNVIRACSVFSTFGFLDDELRLILNNEHKESLKKQMEFIRTNIYDCEISKSSFYEICQKYRNEDIIEKRGTQYIVKPTILAINLASDWLLNTPPDKIILILEALKGSPLSTKFVERLKDLDQLDKAQSIVNELWGPNSPFGSAEVLNTEWGSLLFRYVVEVNPIATSKALNSAFSDFSKEEIKNIKVGRRNLVWALEKLCFRKETFTIAAKTLYSFAVGENETYGNNSENQFYQLFQLFLSGTEANLHKRLRVIKWGLDKKDDDYNRIAINSLGRGILNDRYTRMGGAEKQGSSAPLKDYNPNWAEIYEYWDESISILKHFACHKNPNQDLAKTKLANAFRTLIRDGKVDVVISTVKDVVNSSESYWLDGVNALKITLGFEKLPNEVVQKIEALIIKITPNGIKHLLYSKVTLPEWDSYEKDKNGHYIDKPKLNAEALAKKLVDDKIEWNVYVPELLSGEQRQAFNFGRKIGELIKNKNEFLSLAFEAFAKVPESDRNIELIGGFMVGSDDKDIKIQAIQTTLSEESYNQFAFYLTRVSNPDLADLERLFEIVGESKLPIRFFKNFQYGRALDNLRPDEVIRLCEKISSYGKEGIWTSLSLIYMYCYGSNDKWNHCKEFIKDLIKKNNIIVGVSNIGNIDIYHWSDSIEKILKYSNEVEFSKIIAEQIIEFSSESHFNYAFDVYVKNVLEVLLDDYYESVWEIIGAGLIGDYLTYFNLKNMLGTLNGNWGHQGHLFENTSRNEKILYWVREHNDIAPRRIANMMPIESGNNKTIEWHPFTKSIIDEFSNMDGVLEELSANMGTFGITGSSVPYFKNQKVLLEKLLDHQSEKVREWAEKMIEYTERCIKKEELDDEERFL
ncbi:MAG: hypothetical protein U5R06_23540 [candidate division KSB1 bacterium]|nr:hypothetical protein [candidate division KSB1 bacterium]